MQQAKVQIMMGAAHMHDTSFVGMWLIGWRVKLLEATSTHSLHLRRTLISNKGSRQSDTLAAASSTIPATWAVIFWGERTIRQLIVEELTSTVAATSRIHTAACNMTMLTCDIVMWHLEDLGWPSIDPIIRSTWVEIITFDQHLHVLHLCKKWIIVAKYKWVTIWANKIILFIFLFSI